MITAKLYKCEDCSTVVSPGTLTPAESRNLPCPSCDRPAGWEHIGEVEP